MDQPTASFQFDPMVILQLPMVSSVLSLFRVIFSGYCFGRNCFKVFVRSCMSRYCFPDIVSEEIVWFKIFWFEMILFEIVNSHRLWEGDFIAY